MLRSIWTLPGSTTLISYFFALSLLFAHVQGRYHSKRTLPSGSCRCFPGDLCWPTTAQWNAFNTTLGGKLIATVPIGHPCHNSAFGSYNATACAALQAAWILEETHYADSSSVMAPFYANQSCDPFSGIGAQCVLGTYIRYAVRATDASDIQKTIAFANTNNIRLVIRNTGHDYHGKSTGAGALGIWTHNMKNIQILNYNGWTYTGKAMKMGAGVQGMEAYAAAHAQNLVVVGGNCPTIGLAGGFTQGGGHGPMASMFGMAADQVLEWEVVLASGALVTATPSQNTNLYWALSGGGGGVFAVVVSMTVKAFTDMASSAANLAFTNAGVTQDVFWAAIGKFHELLPLYVDEGGVAIWGFTTTTFSLGPMYGPTIQVVEMNRLMQPYLDYLTNVGIAHTYTCTAFPTFLESYNAMSPFIPTSVVQIGGRLIPRSLITSNNSGLTTTFRNMASYGAGFSGLSMKATTSPTTPNSVNPAWRTALFNMVTYTMYDNQNWQANLNAQTLMTNTLMPMLAALTPGGGVYLNEADGQDPNWQTNFYGSNYAQLSTIKQNVDPDGLFYAKTGVGSENWQVRSDGRLCKL